MSVYVPVKLQHQIRKQFCDRCAYCQSSESLMAITFEFEHITPQSIGAPTRLKNLCLACPPCNRHKSNRQSAIDAETGEMIRFFHPQQDRWSDHFQWSDNFTEIISRTAIHQRKKVFLDDRNKYAKHQSKYAKYRDRSCFDRINFHEAVYHCPMR